MNRGERDGVTVTALGALWVVLLAVAATAPALFGSRALGPDALLDADPLYARGEARPPLPVLDASRIIYDLPRDFAAADGVAHGRVDLWNPRVGFGMPLWSEVGGIFFPANLPFYLAPSRRTYDLAGTLRLVIAGLGAFLLARRRGLAAVPAAAAGGLFELCGAIIATLQFGAGAPPCLLPWALLGAELIAQRHPAAAAMAGLSLGGAPNGGHPMLALVVFVGFGAAIGGHMLAAWRRPRAALAIGAWAIVALAIGLALAAHVLLPLLEAEHAGRLYKNTMIYQGELAWFRAQTSHALPIALFAPATLDGLRDALSAGFPYSLVVPSVGLFTLMLAVGGLLQGGLDGALLAVGLVGFGLTLAPPLLGSLWQLPLLRNVYPMYGWSLVALPLTQAAGRGVATLSSGRGRWAHLAALALVLVGASSLLWLRDPPPAAGFPVRQAFLASLGSWAGWLRLVLPLLLVPSVVLALVLWTWNRVDRRCAVAATAIAAVELLVSVAPTTWFPGSSVLGSPPSPAVRFLQNSAGVDQYRIVGWRRTVGHPATPSLFGLADVRGTAALPIERYVRYLEAIPPALWYVSQLPGALRHPLLDLAAARYIVWPLPPGGEAEPLLEGDAVVRLAYRDQRIAVYDNGAALPRARIAHAAVAVRDRDEAFHRLVEAAASSPHAAAGLTERVFVEPSADGTAPPQAQAMSPQDSEDVQIVPIDDPDRVELLARLAVPGWVVLADTFYPGWTATIDGVATPIHPVDLLFRGVFVPPGAHRIVFRYAPLTFRLGIVLAVAGLAVSALLLVRGARRGGVLR